MAKKNYKITSKAGRSVANQSNTGVGTTLILDDEDQATKDALELDQLLLSKVQVEVDVEDDADDGKKTSTKKKAPAKTDK